jgi:phosphoglycerate kinase
MRYINEMQLQGKKVLVRVDFNVPLREGSIEDDNRIQESLPTIQYLRDQGAAVILCSHLGKPKGEFKKELSLEPVAKHLGDLLNDHIEMASDCVGPQVESLIKDLSPGKILLLENLRFHDGETKNDPEFSQQLAKLADIYVNDAFGVVHRAHASVVGITNYIQSSCAGFLLSKEIQYLGKALAHPDHPFVLLAGGAKVSTKLGVLLNLLDKVDRIIVGGAMANTFRKAQGISVGQSFVEEDLITNAAEILETAHSKGVSLYLPVDYILGTDAKSSHTSGICPFLNVPEGDMILDTGPATHTLFSEVLKDAKTVVWNGPMGVFENPTFSQGSFGIAQTVSSLQALTIVGGGDTDALIKKCGLEEKISFISTGGGSFLEFLEGKELPGLKALGMSFIQ